MIRIGRTRTGWGGLGLALLAGIALARPPATPLYLQLPHGDGASITRGDRIESDDPGVLHSPAETLASLAERRAGNDRRGAPPSPPGPERESGRFSRVRAQPHPPLSGPDDHARAALARAGRLSDPATAPPSLPH